MKNQNLFDALDRAREVLQEAISEHEESVEEYWNSLSETEREKAFYAVVKRIHKAEIEDRGSYRYALYDVFGFDMGMYSLGMSCGYMEIHNLIIEGIECTNKN